jgi:chromatin structure-remodeling complex subunit RSC9
MEYTCADLIPSHFRTNLDVTPKVGIRHIDLYKLYNRVVGEGGYDLCSDTKAKPLMWRTFAEEFVGRNVYTAAQAFQVKNVYYKNLCAYEITHHWKREPPPKEILEDVTAKGGNVMSRTLENFVKSSARDSEPATNGDRAGEGSPEAQRTPKDERMTGDPEDVGSATGRSRGLRQQPPPRVLFQPDLSSTRQPRAQPQQQFPGSLSAQNSPIPAPTPSVNGVTNYSAMTNGSTSLLASYEPSRPAPLTLKPVTTPANNPDFYRNERKRKLEAAAGPLARKYRNIMLPGTGFIGPNIYVRAQLALQSGIADEEQYALHHLVKISHERGDKYRFDQFPGLADALLKKILQVTGLFYDVEWDVTYDDENVVAEETLNGLTGTPDVLKKLHARLLLVTDDTTLQPRFLLELNRIIEAGLIVRNMSLQDENAVFLARLPLMRDVIAVVLALPIHPATVELRHYVLEVAEQVLKEVDVGPKDAIYQGLITEALGEDRGAITTALRTISRIAMNHPSPKRLEDIPTALLHRVRDYLYVEDEELRSACLDFFMQFTSFKSNVEILLRSLDAQELSRNLSRLLFASAQEVRDPPRLTRHESEVNSTPLTVPRLSKTLVEKLLLIDEPERSSTWLRMCFLPDPSSEMTQISLWQAYQGTFAPYQATRPHLIAGEFIKNVSTTFVGASAQVAGSNKYVIKGIRARRIPIDTGVLLGSKLSDKSKELHRCRWVVTPLPPKSAVPGQQSNPILPFDGECPEWFRNSQEMLQHILADHLKLPKKAPVASLDMTGDHMDVDPPHSVNGNALTNGAPLTNGVTPLQATSTDSVQFEFAAADAVKYSCNWTARGCCSRTSDSHPSLPSSTEGGAPTGLKTRLFIRHIATHLPSSAPTSSQSSPPTTTAASSKSLTPAAATTAFKIQILEDETGDAAGVPLRAALVLRNIAHFMPARFQPALPASAKDIAAAYGLIAPGETLATPTKPPASKRGRPSTGAGGDTTDPPADAPTTTSTPSKTNKPPSSDPSTTTTTAAAANPGTNLPLMAAIFPAEVRERFFLALAHCRPLRDLLAQILRAIRRAEGDSLDPQGRLVGEEFLVETARARLLKKLKGDADAEGGDSLVV